MKSTIASSKNLRALPGFQHRVLGEQGWLLLIVFQKLIANVAFIHAVRAVALLVSKGWHLSKGVQFQEPVRFLVKLVPQPSFGVFDGHFM